MPELPRTSLSPAALMSQPPGMWVTLAKEVSALQDFSLSPTCSQARLWDPSQKNSGYMQECSLRFLTGGLVPILQHMVLVKGQVGCSQPSSDPWPLV